MSVPPEATHATVRPTSELRPDFQGGSNLARSSLDLFVEKGSIASNAPPVHL